MVLPQLKYISPEEYFQMEETAEFKHEYYHGEIFAMSGASINDNLIVMNVGVALHNPLHHSDCFVFPSDIKIQVDKAKHYAYPDVSIVCGDIERGDNRDDTIANPLVIIEVLSVSTMDYDRGSKFAAYRNIKSLRDVILIDQYTVHVEYFFRVSSNEWTLIEFDNIEDTFTLRSVNVELSLKAIYDRIKF